MARLVILGAGESGAGAAILGQQQGFDVFVSDSGTIRDEYKALLNQHQIAWEEGEHTMPLIVNAQEVIKSPGIPCDAPVIKALHEKNIPVISEIEFASRYTDAKMICITGSNGKTTTTSLIFDILVRAGLNVGLAGNIGNSLALQVAQTKRDYYVIELSSFQLDDMYDFKADIAILLNITPDHLDRYDHDFQKYIDAKLRITRNQTANEAFIYWAEDSVISREIAKLNVDATLYPFGCKSQHNVAYTSGDNLTIHIPGHESLTLPQSGLSLQGKHNQLNSMAAGIAAQVLNIKNETIRESLTHFKSVPHRLQYVATVGDIRFINDSKATNVNSCWYALESMTTPTVLILGGKDKGNDYSEIDELVKNKCRALVFLGKDNSKLLEYFRSTGLPIADTHSMHDAVTEAYRLAHEGDTVLLSPCCASFDLFHSYEDRGEQFMEEVKRL